MPDPKNQKKSRLTSVLKLVWIVVGILSTIVLFKGMLLLFTVSEYFP